METITTNQERIQNLINSGETHRNFFVEKLDDHIADIKEKLASYRHTREMAIKADLKDENIKRIIFRRIDNGIKELEELLKQAIEIRNGAVNDYNTLIAKANRLKRVADIING